MVLPSGNTTFTKAYLRELLGTGQVSCYQWTEAVRSMWDLAEEVVVLYFHLGHDHVLRYVGEVYSEDGDVSFVARHMLVLVLFLQGLGKRKVMGEKRERKTL